MHPGLEGRVTTRLTALLNCTVTLERLKLTGL